MCNSDQRCEHAVLGPTSIDELWTAARRIRTTTAARTDAIEQWLIEHGHTYKLTAGHDHWWSARHSDGRVTGIRADNGFEAALHIMTTSGSRVDQLEQDDDLIYQERWAQDPQLAGTPS